MKNKTLLPLIILLIFSIFSCNDDEPVNSIVTFVNTEADGSEDAGTVTVDINLNNALETETQVGFELGGTAALNGDYRLLTPSPVTIPAGATSATIEFEIIDDEVVESIAVENNEIVEVAEKQILLELTSATGNAIISDASGENIFTFSLVDDDDIPDAGMKVDLVWNMQNSNNIDEVNLDLYMIYDVVIDNNTIVDAKFYPIVGDSESGFETLVVEDDAPDSEYYALIEYVEGSGDVEFTLLAYMTESLFGGKDTFEEPESDNNILVFGPITKSGSTFSRVANIKWKKDKMKFSAH